MMRIHTNPRESIDLFDFAEEVDLAFCLPCQRHIPFELDNKFAERELDRRRQRTRRHALRQICRQMEAR
jgi:hypothetical protein